jgi:hypothetical protein
MDYLMEVLIGAIMCGALIGIALTSLINVSLPAGLADYDIIFDTVLPVVVILGVVAIFLRMAKRGK